MLDVRHASVAPTRTQPLRHGELIHAHVHDEHQIVYPSRGLVTVRTDVGSWVTPPSGAIWVPAGSVHAHQAYGDVVLHLVGLSVRHNALRLSAPTVLSVGPLLRELIIAYAQAHSIDTPRRRRLRDVLLDELRVSTNDALHLPAPSNAVLRDLCAILSADPSDARTLAELGHEVGASDRTLSRLFRSDLGMTFPQWRTQLRLHKALILLADRQPVAAVAHQCGWTSTSAFISVFKRTFGYTPGTRGRSAEVSAVRR